MYFWRRNHTSLVIINNIVYMQVREYLDLTAKEFHLRTAHSKLFGFWTSEIGGLNQAVHIWEYGEETILGNVLVL